MEKEVKIKEKTYIIKEVKFKDVYSKGENVTDLPRRLVLLSSGISEEEFDNLNVGDGIRLLTVVNEVNGLNDTGFLQAPK